MATKPNKDIVNLNTLDHAKVVIMNDLTKEKPDPTKFKTQEEVENYLKEQFFHHTKLGDFSYDPTIGEIIISMKPELDVYRELADGRHVSTIVQDFFTGQGWDKATIIPGRAGVHNTLVRLRHPTIMASELQQQKTRVERAIEATLSR